MKRSRHSLLLVAASLSLALPALGQGPDVLAENRRLIELARRDSPLMENLEYLSDRIGPRLTGSERLKRANEWTARKMREYGLENVRLEPWTIPVGWERGSATARIVRPSGLPVPAAAMAWAPDTPGRVMGPVVFFDPRDEADLARFRGRLKNAIVLTSPPARVHHHPSLPPPPRPAAGAPRQGRPDLEFLAREGAVAVLIDSRKPQMLLSMTGSWSRRPPLPHVFIPNEYHQMLHRLLARGVPTTLELEVTNRLVKGPITVYNTVGEIRGSDRPDEFVVCGAHLDSWDLATGTVDNGGGAMVVLEAARLIKALGLRPKRTIRFVLFAGEEQGLYGAREYVRRHRTEMDRVSAVFVHDTGTGRVTGIGLHGNPQVRPVLERELAVLAELGVSRYDAALMSGTDHAAFHPEGVPAFWFMQERADYHWMHHTQSDTFDKAIEDGLVQSATVLAVSAYNVARLPDLLPRRERSAP